MSRRMTATFGPLVFDLGVMLRQLHNVEITWGESSEESKEDVLTRRRLALSGTSTRPRLETVDQHANVSRSRPWLSSRRPVGHPHELDFGKQFEVALFIEIQRLKGGSINNAVKDACEEREISRATAFRYLKQHQCGAAYMACWCLCIGQKRFKKLVSPSREIKPPSFDGWSRGKY